MRFTELIRVDLSARTRRRAIVAVVIAGLATAWMARPGPRAGELSVTTAAITTGSIVRHIVASGTLLPVTSVDIGTQVSGTISSIEVDYNSVVHRGQVLLRLDDASYRAELDQARASLLRAEADLAGFENAAADASHKLAVASDLESRHLIPIADLDQTRTGMAQAEADRQSGEAMVEQARAAVSEANVNLQLTIIRAPVDGVVIERNVDPGVTVAAIQSPVLLRLATDFAQMEVQANVDESDIGGIRSGEVATFEVSAYPHQTFTGTVAVVRLDAVRDSPGATQSPGTASAPPLRPASAVADAVPAVVSYPVIITVPNPDEKLRPGMTAVVSMDGLRRDGVARIPNSALSFRPTTDVVRESGVTAAAPAGRTTPGAQVWEYDGAEFTPVGVETGLSDDAWTELVKGPIGPGIAVVTNARLAH